MSVFDSKFTITVGRCRLLFNSDAGGWVLPGGNVVFNRDRAEELAASIDREMRVTPHRYSARAAQLSTAEKGGPAK